MRRSSAPVALVAALALASCSARDDIGERAPPPPTTVAPPATAEPPGTQPTTTTATTTATAATPATPATPTPTTPSSRVPPVDATCPEWTSEVVGAVPDVLPELSGLAVSRARPDVWWGHNDSGDTARIFALGGDGSVITEVAVGGLALDWEDIATATTPDGTAVVWVADTGDNLRIRPRVTLVRVPEPSLDAPQVEAEGASAVSVRYGDGATPDVEALIADPATGDLLLVTKDTGSATVYRVAAGDLDDGEATAEAVAAIPVPDEAFGPTGATAAADGSLVIIRTPNVALVWPSVTGLPVADLLAARPDAPCSFELDQGEAIALGADGSEVITASEGAGSTIVRYSSAV